MRANLRLALVWAALLVGLVLVFRKVPMPGLDRGGPTPAPPPEPSAPLEGAQERYARGVLAAERGADSEARACFEEALRMDPSIAAAHVHLAMLGAHAGAPDAEVLALLGKARAAGFDPGRALLQIDRLMAGELPEEAFVRLAAQKELLRRMPPAQAPSGDGR